MWAGQASSGDRYLRVKVVPVRVQLFNESMSRIFHARCHFFKRFSRAIAASTSSNCSKYTRRLTSYFHPVLVDPPNEIVGQTDVKRPAYLVCENVHPVTSFTAHYDPNNASIIRIRFLFNRPSSCPHRVVPAEGRQTPVNTARLLA
jgi:hypothetical protein